MNERSSNPVVRRWGFYSGNRLAFAGVAFQAGERLLLLRLIEAEHHAHTATLPQRISVEQQVREYVQADIEGAMGPDWRVSFRFEARKLDETNLALQAFGALQGATRKGSDS
jgi:hypothetical protein